MNLPKSRKLTCRFGPHPTCYPLGATTRVKKAGSATDPLWYKDAIIYELHVRAFATATATASATSPACSQARLPAGPRRHLPLAAAVLPLAPARRRLRHRRLLDVHPSYGTLDDFKQFLDAAHQRGLQVMIELVINHTSDQHPWFQRARRAPPGSPERDFYVWSDTDDKYKDARIIFTDTEKSNWTWDPIAQQPTTGTASSPTSPT